MIPVRHATPADRPWLEATLAREWGAGGRIAIHGEMFETFALPALIAGNRAGLATWRRLPDALEIMTLNAFTQWQGIGTALIEALAAEARALGLSRLCLTTTNDNVDALRFYQRRGFTLTALRPDAMATARRLKPSIPLRGDHRIPLRDELDLVRLLGPG